MLRSVDPVDAVHVAEPAATADERRRGCLNCGAALQGPFCSQCGQRDVPPYPTIRELTHDAWQQFSGWDGRFITTFWTLLRRPGRLTVETLEGRRAGHVSPLRVYLTASLLYFLVAAASPYLGTNSGAQVPGTNSITIDLRDPAAADRLTAEQRAQLLKSIDRAPWWAKPMMRSAVLDPGGLRQRFLALLPRVLFALVPVFAIFVALFYRRRPFPQHLIFALHLHAAAFIVMSAAEASNFLRSRVVAAAVGTVGLLFILTYALVAFRRVYGDPWWRVVLKAAGVSLLYLVVSAAAMFLAISWAAR